MLSFQLSQASHRIDPTGSGETATPQRFVLPRVSSEAVTTSAAYTIQEFVSKSRDVVNYQEKPSVKSPVGLFLLWGLPGNNVMCSDPPPCS